MQWIYAGLTQFGAVLAWIGLRLYAWFNPSWTERFQQGFAHYPDHLRQADTAIWIHAASVGEVGLALNIVKALRQQSFKGDLLISTMTTTGFGRAKAEGKGLCTPIFFPFDSSTVVRRAMDQIRPDKVVLLETEIWPNFIRECAARHIPTILVNGRLSSRSYPRYLKIKGFLAPILKHLQAVYAISHLDADRFKGLGCPHDRVFVLGNAKYDSLPKAKASTDLETIRNIYGIKPDDWVWVAGSTRRGEETMILEAYQSIIKAVPNCRFIWAPRHPQYTFRVAKLLQGAGIAYQLRSELRESVPGSTPVVLVDKIGELMGLYGLSHAAFSGGSLINRGGHNFLEIAIWDKPPITGPSYDDFQDAYDWLNEQGALYLVHSARELANQVISIYQDPVDFKSRADRLSSVWSQRVPVAEETARIILTVE